MLTLAQLSIGSDRYKNTSASFYIACVIERTRNRKRIPSMLHSTAF